MSRFKVVDQPPGGRGMNTVKLVVVGVIALFTLIFLDSTFYIVRPGNRGIIVTLGKVSPRFAPEGLGFKLPFLTSVYSVSVKQRSAELKSDCFSSDLQNLNVNLRILYRVPEASVVKIFQEFAGDPFDSLIAPRVQEALKEITATQSAEAVVKKREEVKTKSLEIARAKIGQLLILDDLVIENISLSKELAHAIEQKMVQEQEAAKARFVQQKAEIEAQTAVIKAKGEAEAIQIRGRAMRESPDLIRLQIVEKWDGKAPLVIGASGGGGGSNILLPLGDRVQGR